jgi:tight adherence protein B
MEPITPIQMAMLGVGAMLTLALIAFAFAGPATGKAQTRRLDSLRSRHGASTATAMETQMRKIAASRQSPSDSVFERYIPNPALLAKRLERTGKGWTLSKYAITCLSIAGFIAAIAVLKGAPIIFSLLGGVAIGLTIPHLLVNMQIKKRIEKFNARFPDAIELMVRGLRSGLPISETLGIVSSEIPDPVGFEFRGVSDRIKIGKTMEAALEEAAERIGTPEFQFFTITLAIQRETGGNLAETLMNLAEVLRKRAQMKLKIRAMSSESKASAYIIGALPFMVFGIIYYVNSDYMMKFFTDERLIVAGVGGIIWMGIGAFIMAKMISFEI